MSGPLEIVAIGARTPVGLSAEKSAAAVRAGITRLREYPFVTPSGEPLVIASDPRLEPAREGRDRILPMIENVLEEVTRKLALGVPYQGKRYLLLALPEARPGFSERDVSWVVEILRTRLRTLAAGAETHVDVVGRGHAGVIRAVELVAKESVRSPDALFVVVGADSYQHPDTFIWLERNQQLAQAEVRNGFFPGEGAGALVLCSAGLRAHLRLPRLGVVRGVKTAQETRLRGSETGSFGIAMTQAVLGAVADLHLPRDAVDTLYTDINGERYRSEEWGFVAMRAPGVFKSLVYEAPADCWGDVGAAFGALATVLAVQSYARAYAKGPRTLLMAGSESGLRGAMLVLDPRQA